MKKIMIVLFVLCVGFANGQDKVTTSSEEYNYLTQGYAEQMEKGLDMKSGYELQMIEELKAGDFAFTYYLFRNTNENKVKAVFITCKKQKDKKDKVIYLCLPFNNKELLKKFSDETESMGVTMGALFNQSTHHIMAKLFDKSANRDK